MEASRLWAAFDAESCLISRRASTSSDSVQEPLSRLSAMHRRLVASLGAQLLPARQLVPCHRSLVAHHNREPLVAHHHREPLAAHRAKPSLLSPLQVNSPILLSIDTRSISTQLDMQQVRQQTSVIVSTIYEIVRHCFGPAGSALMLVDERQRPRTQPDDTDLATTADISINTGADEPKLSLRLAKSAAVVLQRVARGPGASLVLKPIVMQHRECGDGSCRVALYLHAMHNEMQQLLAMYLHPTKIEHGFHRAYAVWWIHAARYHDASINQSID